MGSYDAIIGQGSQSFSNVLGTQSGADAKRQELLTQTETFIRHSYESVDAYRERMQKYREELAKKIEAENTQIIEKRLKGVALFNSNATNPYQLKGSLDELQSLLRFAHYNKLNPSIDNGIYLARQQQTEIENQLAKLKQGTNAQDNPSNYLKYYDFEFQNAGSRDIIC